MVRVMRLTKFEHSCLVLEEGGSRLVVDPGGFTTPLGDLGDVVGIVVTHEHADHWTPEQLTRILARNPATPIYAPAGVAAAASDFEVTVVEAGTVAQAGTFRLEFFGGKHAEIHSTIPIVDNVGVLVNDTLYYAGDSFTLPEREIDVLAAPAGAPWLKISETMDYVTAVRPKRSIAVHEMVLSVAGKQLSEARIKDMTEAGGGEFIHLDPTEFVDL
jgi:L-ascorbate metabolism protein UlaG (beta-lactamase superfamily)